MRFIATKVMTILHTFLSNFINHQVCTMCEKCFLSESKTKLIYFIEKLITYEGEFNKTITSVAHIFITRNDVLWAFTLFHAKSHVMFTQFTRFTRHQNLKLDIYQYSVPLFINILFIKLKYKSKCQRQEHSHINKH